MTEHEKKDSRLAAGATLVISLVVLAVLWFGALTFDRDDLARQIPPEPETLIETFLEPELITDAGDHEEQMNDDASPQAQGSPDESDVESSEKVVRDENPDPAPQVEKPVTQRDESPVQATTPTNREEEERRAASAVAGKFSPRNGMAEGRFDGGSSGKAGVGGSGKMAGRKFNGCPKPDVALTHKVVVRVELTVNAEGVVTAVRSARGVSGSPDASIIAKCKEAARGARWAPKKGAAPAPGSITFTITPKV